MSGEKISWTDFMGERDRLAREHYREEGAGQIVRDFIESKADSIRSIPVAKIMREAERGWDFGAVSTLFYLESLGRIELEHDDSYVRVAPLGLNTNFAVGEEPPIADFFDLVWRMLEIGAVLMARPDWQARLLEWSADGRMSRPRLSRTVLESLSRGFGNPMAKWLADLHSALAISVEELAVDQDMLRRMLRAPERKAVTYAIDRSLALHTAGLLEAGAFLSAAPELAGETSINARAILRIATESVEADPALASAARTVVAGGLAHAKRDIQSIAMAWLNANGGAELVAESAELLSPALAAPGVLVEAKDEPRQPRTWAALEPWPANEILERTAVLLEDCSDPLEIEAGLQAWAGMRDPAALAPLRGRAESVQVFEDVRLLVVGIVLASAGVDHPHKPQADYSADPDFPPLTVTRFDEVRQRLLRRKPGRELLATPATAAGWVPAAALVQRMRALSGAVWPSDLAAALLRLDENDPGRAEAATDAARSARFSEPWSVIAYALGGKPSKVKTPSWWVAAARSRSDGYDEVLGNAGLVLPGQAAPADARMLVEPVRKVTQHGHEFTELPIYLLESSTHTVPARQRGQSHRVGFVLDQPTVIPHRWESGEFWMSRPDVARWVGLTWPRSVEFAASVGVMQLARSSADGQENPTLGPTLTAIAESPGAIGELGRACVAFGLSGKHREHRAQCAELLDAELGERLSAVALASTMATVVEACKLARWAEALADAAAISARTRLNVITLLTSLLPRLSASRTGMSALLEVLDDELRRARVAPSDPALLDWLGAIGGTGKAAKAAKSIRSLA